MESEIVELEHQERKQNDTNPSANIIHDDGKEGTEEHEKCSNSRSRTNINHGSPAGHELGEEEDVERKEGDFKIDVVEDLKEEIICRICHLSCSEPKSMAAGGSEFIKLGCHCRGELGMSHRYCAETWFNQRANRACEICGATAKNVKITKRPTRIWIVDFDEMRPIQVNSSRGDSSLCTQSCCCNLLFVCVLFCLLVPWFFRV